MYAAVIFVISDPSHFAELMDHHIVCFKAITCSQNFTESFLMMLISVILTLGMFNIQNNH